LGLALLLAVFLLPRELLTGRIGLSGFSVDSDGGLRLSNPRFAGETPSGEPFSIAADWALPDSPDPTRVELGDLTGEIVVEGGEIVRLTAESGDYRPPERMLYLLGDVEVTTSGGYRMTATSADADFDGETLRVDGPVRGEGALGVIESATMRAARRGDDSIVWFEGGVRVRITPQAD
jgi:lipopolysaccharide export system protein LptC